MFIKAFKNSILDLAFKNDVQCSVCDHYAVLNRLTLCQRCMLRFEPMDFELTVDESSFERLWACYIYNEQARGMMYRYKEGHQRFLCHVLAKMIVEKLEAVDIHFDSVTWVRADNKSRRRRGCDHIKDIAIEVSRALNIRCVESLIKKETLKAQKGLSRHERFLNTEHAFEGKTVFKPFEKVLLIDDVITTGATLAAAADALKKDSFKSKLYGIAVFYTVNGSIL